MNNNRQVIEQLWQAFDRLDFDAAAAVIHDECICEWPQSKERIRGRDNFIAVNKNYPGSWRITILRIITDGNQAASEVRIDIDGRTDYAISFYELRDGKIIKEIDYWPEPYDAPAWRAQWVENMDYKPC